MPRFLPALGFGLVAAIVGLTAPEQPAAVAGRLDYPRFVGVLLAAGGATLALAVALAPAIRRRAAAWRALSLGLGLIVGLGAIELAGWAWPPGDPPDNPFYLATGAGVSPGTTLPFERPPHLVWEGPSRGDLAVLAGSDDPWARPVRFATDAEGFRNEDADARARLVFLGDSHTEAGNVDRDHTFAARTGEGLGLPTRNLGRAGTSPSYQLVVLRRFALPRHPDRVVWQLTGGNDLDEELRFARWVGAGRPRTENWMQRDAPTRRRAWQARSPSWRLFRALRETPPWRRVARAPDGSELRFLYVPSASDDPASHPGWRSLAGALRDGRDAVHDAGAELVLLFVPSKARVYERALSDEAWVRGRPAPSRPGATPFPDALAQLAQALGVPLVDPSEALVAAARRDPFLYPPYDTHLAAAGHAVVAEVLVAALSDEGPSAGEAQRAAPVGDAARPVDP